MAQVQVPGSASYDWLFKQSEVAPSYVDVDKVDKKRADLKPERYATFRAGLDRGGQAILCLVQRCEELEKFFQAARKLSITKMHDDSFDGFIDEDLCDDEEHEEAWELVGAMIEEANQAEA